MLEQLDSVWIPHNGGRFDTIFILKYCLEVVKISPKIIMNGTKVISMIIEEGRRTFRKRWVRRRVWLRANIRIFFYDLDYEVRL